MMQIQHAAAAARQVKPRQKQSGLDQLLAGKYSIRPYSELTRPYQLALAHYMAVDGEAWDNFLVLPSTRNTQEVICRALNLALPQYVKQYGQVKFGIAKLTSRAVIKSVAATPEIAEDFEDWKAYHKWYCSQGGAVDHPRRNRWPVILSNTDDETLRDGWHRLHCYVSQGARNLPAVFYPHPHHLRSVVG